RVVRRVKANEASRRVRPPTRRRLRVADLPLKGGGGIVMLHGSRRALRALLTMRCFFYVLTPYQGPHLEEPHLSGVSKVEVGTWCVLSWFETRSSSAPHHEVAYLQDNVLALRAVPRAEGSLFCVTQRRRVFRAVG